MTHPNFKAAVMAMIDTVDDTGFDSQSVEFWEAALLAALQKLDAPSPNPLPTTEGVTQGWPVPDGWKLVPIEPDDNMICDGFECDEMTRVTDITIPKCEWPASCAECADLATAVYRAMIAAAPLPPEKTQGWQDIATAPKDEQYYLMIRGKVPMVATWDEQDECWFTFNGWYEREFKNTYKPTHWMPLPPPPGQ